MTQVDLAVVGVPPLPSLGYSPLFSSCAVVCPKGRFEVRLRVSPGGGDRTQSMGRTHRMQLEGRL